LASKLVGWDIEIMTHDELAEALERAERWFGQLPHASPELTGALIEEGFLSYNDLTCTDAQGLAEFSGLPEAQSDEVVMYAEEYSDVMEESVEEERRQAEEAAEQARVEAETAAAEAADVAAQAETMVSDEASHPVEETGEEAVVEANSEAVVVSTQHEAPTGEPAVETEQSVEE
jgi:N utilization substance protein A